MGSEWTKAWLEQRSVTLEEAIQEKWGEIQSRTAELNALLGGKAEIDHVLECLGDEDKAESLDGSSAVLTPGTGSLAVEGQAPGTGDEAQ